MVETKRLGDIATYINGYAFKPDDWCKEGLPIVRIQDLTGTSYQQNYYKGDYPAKIEINDGDVLISWSASLGVHIWDRGKALLNQHIFKVVFDKVEVDKQYFVYAVQYNLENMLSKMHGATMKHIVKKDFDNIEVPFPTLAEQKRVASILTYAKDAIEDRKQQLTKLDNLVKSRFVEMFGSIHHSTEYPYLPVEEIASVVSGGTPSRAKPEYWENGKIPWVKTTELQNNIITTVEEYITEEGLKGSSAKIVPKNTVLIAMYGQGKTRGMTGFLGIDASTNQACACLLPSDKINSVFLWKYFELSYTELREMAKGGNQPNLNGNMIKNFPVLMPPMNLQEQFVDFVNQVDKSKVAIQAALDKTQLLFDSLMQEYFG